VQLRNFLGKLHWANLGFSAFERWLQQIVSGKIDKPKCNAFLNLGCPVYFLISRNFEGGSRSRRRSHSVERPETTAVCCSSMSLIFAWWGGRSQKRRIFNAGSLERSLISSPKHQ
jgi:hypothetical protein